MRRATFRSQRRDPRCSFVVAMANDVSSPSGQVPSLGILASPVRTLDLITSLLTPRRVARREAMAIVLQRFARGWLVRRSHERQRTAVMVLQRRWRQLLALAVQQLHAVLLIQRLCKGYLERQRVLSEFQWTTEVEQKRRKNKCKLLMRECTGIFEKRGKRWMLFGRYEAALWQERSVYLDEAGLVYQHVTPYGERKGRTCEVPYTSMQTIKALLGEAVLLVVCKEREYRFAMVDDAICERWAKNLVQLALFASCEVKGYVVPRGARAAPDGVAASYREGRPSTGETLR